MTFVLITNVVLAAAVFTVIVGMIAWTIRVSAPRQRTRVAQPEAAPVRAPQTAGARHRAYRSLAREA